MAGGPDYRHHWHEPAFWRWYWRERVPIGGKILVALAAIALLAGGGYAAESALPAQAASSGKSSSVVTIVRTYTVREPALVKERTKERVVVRRVTTAGRVTETVSGPTRSVTVVHNVPQTHVVTVNGRTHTTTVVRRTTAPAKTTTAPAQTQTVTTTVPTTVVETTTVTVGHKSPAPPPPKTVTVTTTVPAVTITVPGTGP